MSGFGRTSNYTPGDFGCASWTPADQDYSAGHDPATAAEAWAALNREGPTADAVRSYLGQDAQPRYDTAQARAEAQADREAGQ
jgi:hypothetical protein